MSSKGMKAPVTAIGLYGGETAKAYIVFFPHDYGHFSKTFVPKSQVSAITGAMAMACYYMNKDNLENFTEQDLFYEVKITIPKWLYMNYKKDMFGIDLTKRLPSYAGNENTFYDEQFFSRTLSQIKGKKPPTLSNSSSNESEQVPKVEKSTTGKVYGVFLAKKDMSESSLDYHIQKNRLSVATANPVAGTYFQMLFHNGRGYMHSMLVPSSEINSIKRVYPQRLSSVEGLTTARERAKGNIFTVVVLELDVPSATRSRIYQSANSALQMEKSIPDREYSWKQVMKSYGKSLFNSVLKQFGTRGVPTKTAGVKMSLRNKLIRLAYTQPQLREDLLPLIAKSAHNRVSENRLRLWLHNLKWDGELKAELESNPMFMYETELKIFRSHHRSFKSVDTLTGDMYATVGYDPSGEHFTVHTGNKTSVYETGAEKTAIKDLQRYFK